MPTTQQHRASTSAPSKDIAAQVHKTALDTRHEASTVAKAARRLSAGFYSSNKRAAKTASLTTSNSLLASEPPSSSSKFLRKHSFPSFGRSKSPASLLPTRTSPAALTARTNSGDKDPPSQVAPTFGPDAKRQRALDQPTKLPKSKTLGVLSDLKSSISRPHFAGIAYQSRRSIASLSTSASLQASSSQPPHARQQTTSQPFQPSASCQTLRSAPRLPTPSPSQIPVPVAASPLPAKQAKRPQAPPQTQHYPTARMSMPLLQAPPVPPRRRPSTQDTQEIQATSPVNVSKRNSANTLSQPAGCSTPEPGLAQVTTAQPLAYWTGRFSSLNDKYMNKENVPDTLLALRSGLVAQNRLLADPQTVGNDDARHLHIFARLEFLCATDEARLSLRQFQQTFARRFKRPLLLPRGGTMDGRDRGLVARFFGNRRSASEGRLLSGQHQQSDLEPVPCRDISQSSTSALLRCLYGSGVPSTTLWQQEPRRYRIWIQTMM
ncbi:hypothetical protein CDD81_6983 [Ophiocordyceps australis]|uniref:Uncharacterized protein n=1 Tax=Ophiocordyceps australis TaxID=1399860 RepID=A0A2C5XLN2_9HYPO|nr:hypothetical protein CDD81_6983 [Ophiocordyceps australis]